MTSLVSKFHRWSFESGQNCRRQFESSAIANLKNWYLKRKDFAWRQCEIVFGAIRKLEEFFAITILKKKLVVRVIQQIIKPFPKVCCKIVNIDIYRQPRNYWLMVEFFPFCRFVFRLYWFPLKALHSAGHGVMEYGPKQWEPVVPFFLFFNVMLWILLLLNMYWFAVSILCIISVEPLTNHLPTSWTQIAVS